MTLSADDGIVVVEVQKGHDAVEIDAIPAPLREQLGDAASAGLLELLDLSHEEAREPMIVAATDRFERRLVDELSKVRVEMANLRADLREEMATLGANLRQEMASLGSDLRQDMANLAGQLRQETATLATDLRRENAEQGTSLRREIVDVRLEIGALRADMMAGRVDLLKWCFLFWIGQVFAVGSLMAVILRIMR